MEQKEMATLGFLHKGAKIFECGTQRYLYAECGNVVENISTEAFKFLKPILTLTKSEKMPNISVWEMKGKE